MYILVIECKKTLDHKSINDPKKGCVNQMGRMKQKLESYFSSKISLDWMIIGMVCYEQVKLPKKVLCTSCSPYLVHGEAELPAKIAAVEAQLRVERPVCHPSHSEFTSIIKTFLFIIFAKPMDTMTRITDEV